MLSACVAHAVACRQMIWPPETPPNGRGRVVGNLNVACRLLLFLQLAGSGAALDNGLRVPPMGWSSWYGFTSNINETLFRETGDGLVSSGLAAAGWTKVWISDGWAIGRDNKTGHVVEDPAIF